jgi:ATP-dependent Lon protease
MTSPDTEFIRILGAAPGGTEAQPRPAAKAPPSALPVLGLSDIVIFPGMVAPLLVDTAQSIRLIDDVVEGDRLLGLVLQRNPEVDTPEPKDLFEFGCAARVLKMLKFPDNTVRVLVEGLWRIHITGFESQTPYLRANIDVLKDVMAESVEMTALARNANRQFQDIIKLTPALSDQVKIAALNTEAPGGLTDLIAANLNLNLEERQKLLEINDVKERLLRLRPLMEREIEVLNLSTKIQNDVNSSMAKSQRDFYLREQIRAIQRELGETDPVMTEANNLREQIEKNALPDLVKTFFLM